MVGIDIRPNVIKPVWFSKPVHTVYYSVFVLYVIIHPLISLLMIVIWIIDVIFI